MKNEAVLKPGINKVVGGIRIVEISPVEIKKENWLCVGYEEKSIDRGDNLHLGFVLDKSLEREKEADNLLELLRNNFNNSKPILARIHSECLLGDALFSGLCDCGRQLENSLKMILKEGKGIIIYLRQEGRGIGFRNKLSCLALQEGYLGGKRHEKKYSPDEANLAFGYPVDGRDYKLAADFLRFLGLKSIDLISGNPEKISTLKKSGIIIENIVDISREDYTGRELREIEEKISRNYYYPRASDNLKREGSKDGK